jgi:hypothetical protein
MYFGHRPGDGELHDQQENDQPMQESCDCAIARFYRFAIAHHAITFRKRP